MSYVHTLKTTSPLKPLDGIWWNLAGMFLGWTSTKVVQRIMISQKTWPPGAGPVFYIWLYRKLWKSSPPKLLVWFQNNFIGMILGLTCTKVVQRIMISQKTWPPGAGPVFNIWVNRKLWKIFFSKTAGLISKLFHRNDPWVDLYTIYSNNNDISKNMATRDRASFPNAPLYHKDYFSMII